ncbi:bifunctional aspartate kinase/homoserine dehydrogenase I [bacterium]|nr:bifunctional aspartate kinase/homoserine dehydrogenase I [bacterium]
MKILKFGGTSVGSPENILKVIGIIGDCIKQKQEPAVVCSAFGGVTDQLIQISSLASDGQDSYIQLLGDLEQRHIDTVKALIQTKDQTGVIDRVKKWFEEIKNKLQGVFLVKEISPKTLDSLQSFGEVLSTFIISEGLKINGIDAEPCDARQLVITDDHFGSARVDLDQTYQNIRTHFQSHKPLQVITGFIGSTLKKETTTLGRGGSDYTASLFGAALGVSEIEIWTDVDGVMTADPRKVKKAFSLQSITFDEAMEMSHFGAKVIYPPTMQPARDHKIPIKIKNTFNPGFQGTLISSLSDSTYLVKGISSIDDIALLRVQGSGLIGVVGISSRLFGALAKRKVNVILISQASSEHSICFAIDPKAVDDAIKAIEKEFSLEIQTRLFDKVIVERDLSIVAVVGEKMKYSVGIAGKTFQALGKNGINVVAIAQGSSELNISAVINKKDESKALNALHEAFFLSGTKSLNLFIMGTGLIGGTLLEQIKNQKRFLLKERALDLKIVGIGNVERMVFDETGIELERWESQMERSGSPIDLDHFIQKMKGLNLPNTVFVDCTGSRDIVSYYEGILKANISVVTPNKIANSGPFQQYQNLKNAALKYGVKFLYETNVGAGLPVISTLNDLLSSGDKILKVEAVLSGTVSYIFNSFVADRRFSDVVKDAMEKGLSEPDPREDLKGLDVARKLLILAREIGIPMEIEDIQIENILPDYCQKAETVEKFFIQLQKADKDFEQKRERAKKNGKVLRYIGTLENEKAWISLQEVDSAHPFYTLSGSDNMIVFTTERYKERPLVIKGPGAGAEVTAAGVFADIIRISSYLS